MLRLPSGPGLRVDTGIAEGDEIPAEFDSMVAKLIAWGNDRAEAIARLRRALRETMVVLRDGTTNQGFLLELLDHPDLRAGEVDNTWLDRLQLSGEVGPPPIRRRGADPGRDRDQRDRDDARAGALLRLRAPRPARRPRRRSGEPSSCATAAMEYRFRGQKIGPQRFRVRGGRRHREAEVERLDAYERRIVYRGDVAIAPSSPLRVPSSWSR